MLFYRLLNSLLLPVLALVLALRVLRGRESRQDLAQRLGLWRGLPQGPVLWVHGASNGELTSARGIIQAMLDRQADLSVLVTSNSITARDMVQGWGDPRIQARMALLDLRWLNRVIMRRMDLRALVVLEADFWPSRLFAAQRLQVPLALIGGRISQRSFATWQRFAGLSRAIIGSFDLICPQDTASEQRFLVLGAQAAKIGPVVTLKALVHQDAPSPAARTGAPIWLAASTHAGEDDILLRAHALARRDIPGLKMILAPRHPKRGGDIAALAQAQGLDCALRSQGADLSTACDVLIADTLGEMERWYRAAYACFVAGSLVAKGGHTPFEPAAFGCVLLHGPHVENFAESYAALSKAAASLTCHDPDEIAAALQGLQAPEAAATMAQAATKVLAQSATPEAVIEALCKLVLPTRC